ncbi:carboxypeptidase-like regulatory domain-containing protein [Dyadobacter psychrotolerans]|uniref:Carboxypeptidase-like regulatory domain-containing protein n=1 Tax=Dyadobacter psychrotolerans TaxID=2541721 RepID=A0A4R5E006_9BACT|nr:carboxypeptidase-like regulatory domain-containing protein [Dyadobacter psychrotolerans]TDE16863.1 carboxypeptidase-like regulatory domain-containing protein [Dyadobacter psychrotolerans]
MPFKFMKRFGGVIFFIILLFAGNLAMSQKREFRGRVVDEETGKPLEFVTIFITNTTVGTLTDEKGSFVIILNPGKYDVAVTMVGYGPLIYPLEIPGENTKALSPVLFKLIQTEKELNTVSVKAKRDESWYHNLEIFKNNFLGQSDVSKKCKLVNPETLIIVYDEKANKLTVTARDLLVIENPELGYKVSYLLIEFVYDFRARYVSYLGYPKFDLHKGSKTKEKRWAKNRRIAFNGSAMHFARALREKKLEEEGFNLRRLIRKPNPNRPAEEQLEDARKQLRARGNTVRLDANDPISIVLSKASLPKIVESLDTSRVPYTDYIQINGEEVRMAFEGYFQVVYAREKEELSYVTASMENRKPTFQTSVIFLRDKEVFAEKSGSFSEPLGIVFEGYWGWEKVGDMLPLDYMPDESS